MVCTDGSGSKDVGPEGGSLVARRRRLAIPPRVASCIVCGARTECLRASHLWGVRRDKERLRQVVNEIRYNQFMKPTLELERGALAHRLLEKRRGVKKGLREIVDSINSRASPFFMTATFCSPTFGGIRCQPDAVYVEASGDTLLARIVEDKTSNQARYYTQLYAEAVVLTDRYCLVAPAVEEKQLGLGGMLDQGRLPFYQQLKGFSTVILEVSLNPYGSLEELKDSPLPPIRFSVNFHMLPETESKYYIVTQSKKEILNALKHPRLIGEEDLTQTKFTKRGKELRLFTPKES